MHTILLRPLTRFKMGWPDAYVERLKRAIEIRKPISNECMVNTAESEALA